MSTKTGKPAKKAWKGEKRTGPAAARHIPWPEVFKHHISVIDGHTKMLEMIQKHTTPNTGNYTTITAMVKRGHEIMQQAKDSSRAFIPPTNQRETVPLGSSSLSSYPGYSPADIEYGQASEEFGQSVGEMKVQGKAWEAPAGGPEYQIGQAHGSKRQKLSSKLKTESADSKGTEKSETNGVDVEEEGDNPCFVIDTNPTPVLGLKREAEDDGEMEKKKKKKKTGNEVVIETEDISAEVDAKMKEKSEKAKTKDEKKRRRRSGTAEEEVIVKKSKDKSKKKSADV